MEPKRYKPYFDKLFYMIWIPMVALMVALTVISCFETVPLIIMLCTDAFVFYFFFSSIIGYVEIRERTVFIKFGFILKREIPYEKIRGITRQRKAYSESMLSLKNSLDHVNIKYNSFDIVSVSVKDNDSFVRDICERCGIKE